MPGCNQRLLSYAGISKFLSGSLEYGNSDATVDGVLDWDIFKPRKAPSSALLPILVAETSDRLGMNHESISHDSETYGIRGIFD